MEIIQLIFRFVMNEVSQTNLSKFRKNLETLSDILAKEAGVAVSTVGKYIARDPKFFDSCQIKDFRVGTYDFVMARFSSIWPEHLTWPAGIARPAPSDIDPETLDWFEPRLKSRDKQKGDQGQRKTPVTEPANG